MLNYLLHIATVFLALLYLAKDWDSHKKSWRRLAVLILISVIGIGGAVNTYFTNKMNEYQHHVASRQRIEDKKQIAALKSAVETANINQENNTKQFVRAFELLFQKVSNLQAQVKTAGLKQEAEQLKAELRANQKAMTPPKARLTFTFPKPRIDDPPLHTITLPVIDDVVHVEFRIKNETDVTAQDVEITLLICDKCKFHTEPSAFSKIPGQDETRRTMKFARMYSKTESENMSVNIKVPPNLYGMGFGITYRCTNCMTPEPNEDIGNIFFSR